MFTIFEIPYADPVRLPLANGPGPIAGIVGVYLLVVLKLGPQLMANRQPFQLRTVLKIYNVLQILFNSLFFAFAMYFILSERPYDFNCLKVLPQEDKNKPIERLMNYLFYLNKIFDLMDTVFFVLRKSYKQITMLHLIHHVYMTTASYTLIRFHGYGGHVILVGYLNAVVHSVMYTYYFLSAHRQAIKQSLWWKQYITILQMVQFVIMFVHSIWTLMQPDCDSNRAVIYLVVFASGLMFVMFTNFFIHAYILPQRKKLRGDKLQ